MNPEGPIVFQNNSGGGFYGSIEIWKLRCVVSISYLVGFHKS